jgi:hypothetical protein
MLGLASFASICMEHNAGSTFQIPLAIAAGIILLIGIDSIYLLEWGSEK